MIPYDRAILVFPAKAETHFVRWAPAVARCDNIFDLSAVATLKRNYAIGEDARHLNSQDMLDIIVVAVCCQLRNHSRLSAKSWSASKRPAQLTGTRFSRA
jgi:hypothetical protein